MNKVDCVSELKGEYNIKVLEGTRTVYSSGWRKNTILANGLKQLYSKDVSFLTTALDLGGSSSLPGSLGYNLLGVILPAEHSVFTDLIRGRHSVTSEGTARVFYSYFTSNVTTVEHVLREFAVKPTDNSGAFARNVFTTPVTVLPNQYIVFEYRLRVLRYHTFTSKLPFKTKSGYSFTVPITGVGYNIPYNEMYRNDNNLLLLKDKTPLPNFGTNWPSVPSFAVVNSVFSTFTPKELGHSLDNRTRTYSVSTAYLNISARPYGLHNQINTIALARNSKRAASPELTSDRFMAIRMAFPLALYNYENEFFGLDGVTADINKKAVSLSQLIGPDTDINIIADSSGSMPDTLNVLREAVTSGKLKEKLLPYYNNDSTLYDSRVNFYTSGLERTFNTDMLNRSGRGGKRLINLVFQDETTGSLYNNANTATYNNDITYLRNSISTYTPGDFIGVVFQVAGYDVFKNFLQGVENGTGVFTAVNLADRPEIKFIYDVEVNSTQDYYVNTIVDAILSIKQEIIQQINEIPSSFRASPYIYIYDQYATNSTRYNKFDLYFNYIWREV